MATLPLCRSAQPLSSAVAHAVEELAALLVESASSRSRQRLQRSLSLAGRPLSRLGPSGLGSPAVQLPSGSAAIVCPLEY
jgi:hypothetical protein